MEYFFLEIIHNPVDSNLRKIVISCEDNTLVMTRREIPENTLIPRLLNRLEKFGCSNFLFSHSVTKDFAEEKHIIIFKGPQDICCENILTEILKM